MSEQPLNRVVDEAAHWMMRLQSGEIGEDERQAFIAWQNSHPTHAQVFQRLADNLGLLRREPLLGLSDEQVLRALNTPSSRRSLLRGSLAVVAAGGLGTLSLHLNRTGWVLPGDLYTATSERATYSLADGSRLSLDARTRVTPAVGSQRRGLHFHHVTADVYRVDIRDRITLSSNLDLSNNPVALAYLQANGIGDISYTTARYFNNAVDTRTTGVDLVTNYRQRFAGDLRWNSTLGYNYNRSKVTEVKDNPAILDSLGLNLLRVDRRERLGLLGDTTPRHKLTFGNDLNAGNWTLRSNLVRYGTFTSYQNNAANDQTFDAAWILDLAADYAFDNWLFTLGGDNLTDQRPERLLAANSAGGNLKYSTFSPYGYSGAFYYGKVSYSW